MVFPFYLTHGRNYSGCCSLYRPKHQTLEQMEREFLFIGQSGAPNLSYFSPVERIIWLSEAMAQLTGSIISMLNVMVSKREPDSSGCA